MINCAENNSENTQESKKIEYSDEKRPSGRFKCITLVGHVEGHYIMNETQKTTKYENILPELVEINTDRNISGLLILLNTVGGEVYTVVPPSNFVVGEEITAK